MSALSHESLFDVPEDWWRRRRCVVCGCALSVAHEYTYLVQRQQWVKIGATNDPHRRVNELRRPAWAQHIISPDDMDWREPLSLLGVMLVDAEHELHQRFVGCHVIGEWFLPDATMRTWLGGVA